MSLGGTASSVDLGDSSKYSDELLRAEVGKGSMRTAFDHGLVDPKAMGNSNKSDSSRRPKGNLVNIPEPRRRW